MKKLCKFKLTVGIIREMTGEDMRREMRIPTRRKEIERLAKHPSIFRAIGFPPKEANMLDVKARLHGKVYKYARKYSAAKLQKILEIPKYKIEFLLKGKISEFSALTLIDYLERLLRQI